MAITEVEMKTEVSEVQKKKTLIPIPVTVEGINTVVMVVHREKAKFGIKDTSLGMVMIELALQEEQPLQGK